MGKYFGTDGFRGEANAGLTAEHAFHIGRFLGAHLPAGKGRVRVVIGKDTRRSSYMLEQSLAAGLNASGADAYLLHVTTTPSVAYVTRTESFDCGIMITASHNVFSDNGIKLMNARGEKMDDALIAKVEEYLDGYAAGGYDLPRPVREGVGRTVDHAAGRNRYISYLISLGLYSFKDIRVGLDCANGAAWSIARAVFEALGATTVCINDRPNGMNINERCGAVHPEALQALVRERHLDVGFAFDGDADRCICVDERGNIVNGDHILYLCAKYMKERGELRQSPVVATVMSNMGLFRALEREGIACVQTAVGDRFVHAYMEEHGCALGGEQSGHVIFSKYATTGDGILTSIKVMEVMLSRKMSLSRLCAEASMYPQLLRNVPVRDREAAMLDPDVLAATADAERLAAGRARLVVRASGTESVIRIMAEGESEALCQKLIASVLAVLRRKGHEEDGVCAGS